MNDKDQPQQSLHEKLFKDVKTDHGKFGIGDLLVLVMGGFLLLFTVYFTWDFLNRSMPVEYKILSIAGLWGLDFGVIFWSLTYIFGSTSKWQDFCALGMLALDYIGVALTTIVGFLTGRHTTVPELIQTVTLYGVIGIILINVLASVLYHLASPQTAHKRQRRKMLADLDDDRQRAEIELQRQREQLRLDEQMVEQRKQIVEKERELARQAVELEAIEKQTRQHLNFAPPVAPMRAPETMGVPSGLAQGNGHEPGALKNA